MSAVPGDEAVDVLLRRREKETEVGHRAFLLWAMQDEERRSVRACGRAVARSEACLREWRGKHEWDKRAETLGDLATVKASIAYRILYYGSLKLREIVEVESLLPVPFLPDTPIAAGSPLGEQVSEAIRPRARDEDAKGKQNEEQRRRHLALVDGAIGLVARRIAAGEVKVSLRDIPHLLDLRSRMVVEGSSLSDRHGGGVLPIESTRVRFAREKGGDVLAAMHDDALELAAILGALRSASEVRADLALQQGPEGRSTSGSNSNGGTYE